jgi:glycosyltransferase involved in cell wall biosynthesis
MDISIVIPTWNNCRRLAQTLSALCGCDVPPALEWELVVVNNQCTDDTNWRQ